MAISLINYNVELVCLTLEGFKKISFYNGKIGNIEVVFISKSFFKMNYYYLNYKLISFLPKLIKDGNYGSIYFRRMFPFFKLIKLMKKFYFHNIHIYYEIPTYPFFFEQISESKHKLYTILKLIFEIYFFHSIKRYIYRFPVIVCNSKKKLWKNMRSFSNGINNTEIHSFEINDSSKFNIIGVGTIYKYHGYEKIIESIKKHNGKLIDGKVILFHIVGKSTQIDKLKFLTKKFKIEKNIIFHGEQPYDFIYNLYRISNLGIGTLSLNLRNADIDTGLKNMEYIRHSIPVLTSGNIKGLDDSYYIKISPQECYFNLNDIWEKSLIVKRNLKNPELVREFKKYEWKNIMNDIILK
jgi:glycosyltransferase involved in cell wall biosynthesis